MIPRILPLDNLLKAKEHYSALGWEYIETPWVVSADAMNITRPSWVPAITQPALVASGEQSFLELILQKKLKPGKWQTLTPCYRAQDGDANDGIHFSQFYKLELMWYKGQEQPHPMDPSKIIDDVVKFVGKHLEVSEEPITDEPRAECETWLAYDLECDSIEIGSYGNRRHDKIGYWVYGTGLAEPRFSDLLRNAK